MISCTSGVHVTADARAVWRVRSSTTTLCGRCALNWVYALINTGRTVAHALAQLESLDIGTVGRAA